MDKTAKIVLGVKYAKKNRKIHNVNHISCKEYFNKLYKANLNHIPISLTMVYSC